MRGKVTPVKDGIRDFFWGTMAGNVEYITWLSIVDKLNDRVWESVDGLTKNEIERDIGEE